MSEVLVIGGAGYIGGAISNIMDVAVYDNLMFEDRYFKIFSYRRKCFDSIRGQWSDLGSSFRLSNFLDEFHS